MKAGNCAYRSPGDLPETIPVFPLPGALLLPRSDMPLNIFEPRYIAMIDFALRHERIVGMIQPDESVAAGSLTITVLAFAIDGILALVQRVVTPPPLRKLGTRVDAVVEPTWETGGRR